MDDGGQTTLVWHSRVGPAISVASSTIAPGGSLAGPVRTLSRGLSTSLPALAVAGSGQAAVAWLAVARTSSKPHAPFEATAVQIAERPPDGQFGTPETVWQAPAPEPFPGAAELRPGVLPAQSVPVQVAVDSVGDEALVWETTSLMVATRSAGGHFTAPTTLASSAEAATEVPPVVTIDPTGRVTVLWTTKEGRQLQSSSWSAGSTPSPSVVLAEDNYPSELEVHKNEGYTGDGLQELQLTVNSAGVELAAWLSRPSTPVARFEPPAFVVNTAWREPTGGFGPPQTVSTPGVEALEPSIALRPDGRALIAWTENTGEYCVGDSKYDEESCAFHHQLHYATAPLNGPFAVGIALTPRASNDAGPAVAWSSDGTALIAWKGEEAIEAVHSTPEGAFPRPTEVGQAGFWPEGSTLAAGGQSDPVLVWGANLYERPIRYAIANGLGGPSHPVIAPILEQDSRGEGSESEHGIRISVRCSERCRLHATARFVISRLNKFTGGETFTEGGTFTPLNRTLPANHTEHLLISGSRKMLTQACRRHATGDEIQLSARGLRSRQVRAVTEQGPLEGDGGDGSPAEC